MFVTWLPLETVFKRWSPLTTHPAQHAELGTWRKMIFHRCRDHRFPSEIMIRMSLREFHRAGREFLRKGFELFRDIIRPKRERKPHRIQGLDQVYSLKRLT